MGAVVFGDAFITDGAPERRVWIFESDEHRTMAFAIYLVHGIVYGDQLKVR